MAIFHLTTKPLSRSSGRSAVAAAAYRSGTVLTDMRQGLTHDYERRFGVEHKELVLPEGADAVYWTRQQLWNAAEFAEARKDGRTAREWLLALPEELSNGERQELALTFARELAGRYGCAVDVGIHLPDKEGDQRNHHAHLLATTRVVAGEGLGDKTLIELSDAKRLSMGLGQGRQEIEQVRALWAERANQALEKKGRGERIDPRSLVAQQEEALLAGDVIRAAVLDRMPEIKVGWKATAMERRTVNPIATERGDQLRAIRRENGLRKTLGEQIASLKEKVRLVAQLVAQRIASDRAKKTAAKKVEEERRQQVELAAKQRQEKGGLEQRRRKEIELRAGKLWDESSAGRQEKNALEQRKRDLRLESESLQEVKAAEAALQQWNEENRWVRFLKKPVGYEEEVQKAAEVYQQYRHRAAESVKQLEELTEKRVSAWPGLLKQAETDLEEIAVRLSANQVKLLIEDAYQGDKESVRRTFARIEQRTHEMPVLGGAVVLDRFEGQEDFSAVLLRKDKALLDRQLSVLHSRQHGAAKRKEQERSRGRERDSGHGDD